MTERELITSSHQTLLMIQLLYHNIAAVILTVNAAARPLTIDRVMIVCVLLVSAHHTPSFIYARSFPRQTLDVLLASSSYCGALLKEALDPLHHSKECA